LAAKITATSDIKPLRFVLKNINKYIYIRLKDNTLLYGKLAACDPNMNVVLMDAEEKNTNGDTIIKYGKVFIRGNNIIYFQFPDLPVP